MRTGFAWLLLTSFLVSGCGTAGDRYNDAKIRFADGQLCFSIADATGAGNALPLLSGIRLYERVSGEATNIWEADYLGRREGVNLSPQDCLPYAGGDPDPAPPLSPGKAYSVTILADVELEGRFTARWYSGYFCMLETDQGLMPHQVPAGDQAKWGACGPGVRW